MVDTTLGPFTVVGGMQLAKEPKGFSQIFKTDFNLYLNGFSRAFQIGYAVDNDMPADEICFWNPTVDQARILVRDIAPVGKPVLFDLHVEVDVAFDGEQREGRQLTPLGNKEASEMVRGALYSYFASYDQFYG